MRHYLLLAIVFSSAVLLTGCSSYNATLVETVEKAEELASDRPQSDVSGKPGEARFVKHLVQENAGAITIVVTVQNVSSSPDTYQLEVSTISGLRATDSVTIPAGGVADVPLSLPGAFDLEATVLLHSALLGQNIAVETIPLS